MPLIARSLIEMYALSVSGEGRKKVGYDEALSIIHSIGIQNVTSDDYILIITADGLVAHNAAAQKR